MKSILIMAFFLLGFSATQAQVKLGIVNLDEIGKNMTEAKDAEKVLAERSQRVQDTLQQMQAKLEDEFAAYQKQKAMMPVDQQQKKEQDLQAQQVALQQYYQDKLGQQGELVKLRMELLAPIREKIEVAIDKVAKTEKISLVLDKANPALLYSEDSMGITFKVLDQLKRGGK